MSQELALRGMPLLVAIDCFLGLMQLNGGPITLFIWFELLVEFSFGHHTRLVHVALVVELTYGFFDETHALAGAYEQFEHDAALEYVVEDHFLEAESEAFHVGGQDLELVVVVSFELTKLLQVLLVSLRHLRAFLIC